MKTSRAFAAFCCGVIVGWATVVCFMFRHDRSGIGGVLWLITLWLPVAATYSVIIIAVSHWLLGRFASTLLLLLGCVVGLLPFVGFWPPYFFKPVFLLLLLGIHLAAV